MNRFFKKFKKIVKNARQDRIYKDGKKLPDSPENLKTYGIPLYGYGIPIEEVKKTIKDLNQEILRVLKKDGFNIYTVRNHMDGDFKKGTHRGEDMYEMNGFIVHYFSENKIKNLLDGFTNVSIENFDEGSFPRKLSLVINKKK